MPQTSSPTPNDSFQQCNGKWPGGKRCTRQQERLHCPEHLEQILLAARFANEEDISPGEMFWYRYSVSGPRIWFLTCEDRIEFADPPALPAGCGPNDRAAAEQSALERPRQINRAAPPQRPRRDDQRPARERLQQPHPVQMPDRPFRPLVHRLAAEPSTPEQRFAQPVTTTIRSPRYAVFAPTLARRHGGPKGNNDR